MVKKYIKRDLEKGIKQLSKKFPIITVVGPRQSGKTTLLRHIFPDYVYVTLESPDIRSSIQNDPRGFLEKNKMNNLIIDEFQRFSELTSYLQEYADDSYKMGQVMLTGSQQYNIIEKVSQSLAGRTAILKLLPLSLKELSREYSLPDLETLIVSGFYPAIYDRNISPQEWYPSYVETYIERDVQQLINIGNIDTFLLFITLLAGRTGQLLNMNNVGIEAGVSQPTAKQWFSILKANQLIFTLRPIHRNINKRLVKTPKLYFSDTGLLVYLLGIRSSKDLETHPLRGAIFENFVISEFFKYNYGKIDNNYNLLFYRDKRGREVDLIIEQGTDLNLFEIKYSHTFRTDFFRHLNYLSNELTIKSSSIILAGDHQLPNVFSWRELADFINFRLI